MENNSLTSFSSPESKARLLRSLQSTPKKIAQQEAQKQAPQQTEPSDEQVYFPGERIPVEYQDTDNLPVPEGQGFMNDSMRKQIADWEKNHVADEQAPEQEPEQDENSEEESQES